MPEHLVSSEPTKSETEQPVRLSASAAPVLMVIVDAEEEFDWSGGFDRDNTGVSAMSAMTAAQEIFDGYGIRPVYLTTYPVAVQEEGAAPIRDFVRDGRAVVGAHLHPWVTPPYEELVNDHNSFPGNLPVELEEAKLRLLTEAIEDHIGERPRIYQAGRYGIGPNTPSILESLGYQVDFSVSPPFDYSPEGGPDFSRRSCDPFWFGPAGSLLELPTTGAYVGWWPAGRAALHGAAVSRALRWSRLEGILSRVRAVERLRLSPEGFEAAELMRLTRALIARGVRTFTFSFHGPTCKPGCTSYVDGPEQLQTFLDRFRRYFDDFFGELGGTTLTPLQLREQLLAS